MADKGPLLTSCIIFYLSIGAAIFQILEQPNWDAAKYKFIEEKRNILKRYTCLTKEDLDAILEVVSEAAGQGVPIKGEKYIDTWDWPNSVVFAATIVTTIGYGNVAPKTAGGRVFCILYGLCGIPLCLVWISEVGSFFGDRAKRLSQVLIHKGVSVKKVQFTCTAIFLLWGLVVHLVIPPFIFMSLEGWTYLEGLYFSFITLTTVGFGDYVAGVNPNMEYPRLYKVCAELWIYMGLAWLSLFFSWNVHMVVEAHKVFKKRRQRHRQPQPLQEKLCSATRPAAIDIFNFLSEKTEDYSTVIKGIGESEKQRRLLQIVSRSKSCSDLLAIQTLEHSPRLRRRVSLSEVLLNTDVGEEGGLPRIEDMSEQPLAGGGQRSAIENKSRFSFDLHTIDLMSCGPDSENIKDKQCAQHPDGGSTRFTVSKVAEGGLTEEKDENG